MASVRTLPLGTLLKRHRVAAGLTQEELAERTRVSVRAIGDLERGVTRRARRDTLALLAEALQLSAEDRADFEAAVRQRDDTAAPPPASTTVPTPPLHNLPAPLTPLIGRERDEAAAAYLLRQDKLRLLTLTGAPGIGKTRLGLQVAAELADDFADGVWFVRLSRLTDPALVVPTIAQTLGLNEAGSRPIEQVLRDFLRDKHLLLALDNFEQVVAAAPQMATLLESSPGLKVLVTSRTVLHVRGEHEMPVVPLALPPMDAAPRQGQLVERLAQYPAVALFIQRAQDAKPDFRLTAATAPVVAAICARLDGLPLALELAAAKVKLLLPAALLQRLERRLPVLTGGARDLEERQQTMRNTLAWSEDLLSPEERRLFRRLAVFVGGCTLEAAEAVCMAPEGADPLGLDVLERLGTLMDQSLVQQRTEGAAGEEAGEVRFGMLQVIREYALERLEASGEAEALRRAHADYYLALAEQAEPELQGRDQAQWLARLERDLDNLRATLAWAHERREAELGLRLAGALWWFWYSRGHFREGRAWLEGLLALGTVDQEAGPSATPSGAVAVAVAAQVRARGLRAAGQLALWQGDYDSAAAQLEAALPLASAAGDRQTAASALNYLGVLAYYQGDLERSEAHFTGSLALAQELGDVWQSGGTLSNLGEIAYFRGDWAQAATRYEEALALHRARGAPETVALILNNLGFLAGRQGDLERAAALHREALALFQPLSNRLRSAEGLEALAITAAAAGQGERAAHLWGAAAAQRETLGAPLPPVAQQDLGVALAPARAALGEEAWAAACAAGQALSLEQAIAEALGEASSR